MLRIIEDKYLYKIVRVTIILFAWLIWTSPCHALTHSVTTTSAAQHHGKKVSGAHKTSVNAKMSRTRAQRSRHYAHIKKKPHKPAPIAHYQEPQSIANNIAAENSYGFVSSMEHKLVAFVHDTVTTLRYSAYKLGGSHFDTSRGVYVVDCSNYVDHVLEVVYPHAYSSLVNSSGTSAPNTQHYYNFFNGLEEDTEQRHWNKVNDVQQLQPGDIVVFRYKNTTGRLAGGHVMVVMNKPIHEIDGYLVRVADSAPVGHSEDTRPGRVSGIGIGTLLLKADPDTGQPSAYAWKVGSRWKHNVNFAMARPIEIGYDHYRHYSNSNYRFIDYRTG
jgi:hypothetical protein